MDNKNFKSELISQTEHIVLNGSAQNVFPLFGAYEEKKWAEGWNPVPVYPETESIHEGATFVTESHSTTDPDYIWRINKFDDKKLLIQYLVMSVNRYWTISIHCMELKTGQTQAEITYAFIGTTQEANDANQQHLQRIYAERLKDWEQEINAYLATC